MTWLIARVRNSSTSRSEGRAGTVTGYVRRRVPWSNRALENDAGPCVPARGISLEATPGRRLVDATVAAEDKSFWSNPGVDVLGIMRAVYADLTTRGSGSGGASTITQQLVKQRIVGNELSIKRKIREAILAIQVTNTYSKP